MDNPSEYIPNYDSVDATPDLLQTDPAPYDEHVTQRASQSLAEVDQGDQLTAEYCQKYPELVPFKDAIINEAMAALFESHLAEGEQIDDRQAIEQGITRFLQKLGHYHQTQTQKQTQHHLQQKMLRLDTGHAVPTSQPHSVSQALRVIGDNDRAFSQYRQHYLTQKGIKS
jgi:hypothetical protein